MVETRNYRAADFCIVYAVRLAATGVVMDLITLTASVRDGTPGAGVRHDVSRRILSQLTLWEGSPMTAAKFSSGSLSITWFFHQNAAAVLDSRGPICWYL